MENQTLHEIISAWVSAQTEPFTSRDILDANDEIDNITQVSRVMNKLFNDGIIARKKIDGLKFVFISAEKSPEDFEKKSAVGLEQLWPAGGKAQSRIGFSDAAKNQVKTTAVDKVKKPEDNAAGLQIPKPSDAVADLKSDQQQASGASGANTSMQLPATFTLKLEAPGGLVITITGERSSK